MNILKRATALLSILAVAGLPGCASTATPEGTGGYVDDAAITSKGKAAIFEEPLLKSGEITVETFKGVVRLGGFVATRASADTAVQTARNVQGVWSVKSDIRLR